MTSSISDLAAVDAFSFWNWGISGVPLRQRPFLMRLCGSIYFWCAFATVLSLDLDTPGTGA